MTTDPTPPAARRRLLIGIITIVVLVGAIIGTALLTLRGEPAAAPSPSASASPQVTPTPTVTPTLTVTPTPVPVATVCPVAEAAASPAGIPADRAVNIGVEDLVDDRPGHLDDLAERLDAVNANTVSIAVGRLDWIEFPWAGNEQNLSSDVIETGRDYVGEAVNALRCAADGTPRTVVLGIDALFGRDLERGAVQPGQSLSGWSSDLFASLTAWKDGGLRERLVEFATELAVRYEPDAINITELFFDWYTYGPEDLADFQQTSGLDDWPRSDDGEVDTHHPAISSWRSDVVVAVFTALDAALEPLGVAVTSDVRGPLTADTPTRADIGQDYAALLVPAARLNVWDFPGINRRLSVLDADELTTMLFAPAPDSYSLEIGLWQDGGTIAADVLRRELGVANDTGIRSVSVTPASLMTDELWAVLAEEWTVPASP